MKLLVVSHSCATAANQRLYVELEAALGAPITLAIPAQWRDEFGNHLDEAPCPGLRGRVLKVPVLANGNIIFHTYRKAWRRFLREERFDAIYLNHEPYALATAQLCFAARGLPAAFGFYSCQNIAKAYPPPFRWLEGYVYRRSRFAFPITPAVAEVLRAKGFRGEATVCPLPVDLALCHPRGEAADHALLPRAGGEAVLGYVGRLVEAKGLRTLARALVQVADLPWRFIFIGTGPLEAELRALFQQSGLLGRITFAGYTPHTETPRYLSAMDALILPSETQANWKEQFGRVIPEAMACGTAVIGSDSGEIPTLIRQSGGGLIFPERDAAALAAALRTLLTDAPQREHLAAQGGAWVREHLSLQSIAATMAATLERAIR